MALDKLVDSTQLDNNLTSVANAIRAKSGGTGQLAFPAGFVSEIGNIPTGGGGITPTGTKNITITENGTITEDVTNYANVAITVNVPSSGGNGLPTEYQAVEYIDTNDSGAYIETNFEPEIGDDIFATFALNKLPTNKDGFSCLFSAGQGNQQLICLCGFNSATAIKTYNKYFVSGNATEQILQLNANTFFSLAFLRLNESTAILLIGENSPRATIAGELDGTSKNLFIAMRANKTSPLNGKISKFLVLNHNILRCNLIPCYRKSDYVIGMYDTVSRVFYTNAGTGNFLKGAEV